MSFVFVAGCAVVFGYPFFGLELTDQGIPSNWRVTAVWALVLVFVVPWIAARIAFYFRTSESVETAIAWLADFAFSDRGEGWVRAQTSEGVWMGGWYGGSSFASSYPDPRELYLEVGYAMNNDGTFVGTVSAPGGIYIRCDDIRLVDFTPTSGDEAANATISGSETEIRGN